MNCQIEGCPNDAKHIVDAKGGAAYRLCDAHVPAQVTEITGEPKSVNILVNSPQVPVHKQ